jgi:hypothetical protein
VTGLADGADRLAGDIFLAGDPECPGVERILGAILPCERREFVEDSPVDDVDGFERQAAACAFIVELDGSIRAEPDSGGHAPTRRQAERTGAFEAQSEILLRQADLLIAIDDEAWGDPRVGGTRQTMRNALRLGLPVILVRLGREGLAVLRASADFDEPVFLPEINARLAVWRLAGELIGSGGSPRDPAYVDSFVQEFFAPDAPRGNWGGGLWAAFERLFARPAPSDDRGPTGDSPYEVYRRRASLLSSHYGGLYRGSFLLGYILAVVAVGLAVGSLAVLLSASAPGARGHLTWLSLVSLGVAKLVVLAVIAVFAATANRKRYAHRAADYRYLSERLRSMRFMPRAGSLRPPYSWSLPYTTRVMEQGVVDHLFLSIVRQARPLESLGGVRDGRVLRQAPRAALDSIRLDWLAGQVAYHERNASTLGRMSRSLEHLTRRLNQAVIMIVLADLGLLAIQALGLLPVSLDRRLEEQVAPTLIFLAAVLPAAIASLGGVRFQSECARLADRSEHMAVQLAAVEERARLFDLRPVRALDALRLAEDIATLTIDEVAEWSAIYGKEFVEM